MPRTQQKDILLCAAPIQAKFRAPVKTAFQAREDSILNPSPSSPGGEVCVWQVARRQERVPRGWLSKSLQSVTSRHQLSLTFFVR